LNSIQAAAATAITPTSQIQIFYSNQSNLSTVTAVINNQKRVYENGLLQPANKTIKTSPISTSSSLTSNITQNDDLLVDSKALLTSSSVDSDNSSHSKASIDDYNFDSNKKLGDVNEKKKEKLVF
jgi:hypothetical protein